MSIDVLVELLHKRTTGASKFHAEDGAHCAGPANLLQSFDQDAWQDHCCRRSVVEDLQPWGLHPVHAEFNV